MKAKIIKITEYFAAYVVTVAMASILGMAHHETFADSIKFTAPFFAVIFIVLGENVFDYEKKNTDDSHLCNRNNGDNLPGNKNI